MYYIFIFKHTATIHTNLLHIPQYHSFFFLILGAFLLEQCERLYARNVILECNYTNKYP